MSFRRAARWIYIGLIGARAAGPVAAADFDAAALNNFLKLWPGVYHNLDRVADQEARGVPVKDRNRRQILHIRKVDLPSFGPEAYYAEWRSTDTDALMRQRIYAFTWDRARGAIRLGLHIWPADREFAARTERAYLEPILLEGLTPADMAGIPGCDVYFRPSDENEFSGEMDKGTCAFPAPDGTPIYSWSQMKISRAGFSYLDGWFHPDGTPYQSFGTEWYAFAKIR